MNCPSCDASMNEQNFEGNYGEPVSLDLCHTCNAIWFDNKESLRLSPSAILELFKLIHEERQEQHSPIPKSLKCPRCGEPLVDTSDIQRNTRFSYSRCPVGHGHFITFLQFLREKNIVRSAGVKQLNELKKRVKVIRCSNCGAPVELEKMSACSYCQSPISIFDPQQVELALGDLKKKAERPPQVDPTLAVQLTLDKLSVENFYNKLESENPSHQPKHGLIELGLGALVDLIKQFT